MGKMQERALAAAAGETTYYTGRPCHKGHVAKRYTASGVCAECVAERNRANPQPRPPQEKNAKYQEKWNASKRARDAKQRWKERDPKNAWACSAVGGAKARARAKGLKFDLDKAYVRALCADVCPVLGTPFVWFGQKLRPESPSLDRIRPDLGYVKGNVAVISQRANAIKSDAAVHEIEAVAAWLRRQT